MSAVDMTAAPYPLASSLGDNQRRVSGEARIGPGGHARPVADAPIDGLLMRTDELSKRWVLALVGASALEDIATLELAPLARAAPPLCADVLAAVRSDAALQPDRPSLEGPSREGGAQAREPLCLGWVADSREAVLAVEALRGVLWEALVYAAGNAELAAPSEWLLSDLADRLAYVCSVVLTRSFSPAVRLGVGEPQVQAEPAARRSTPPWAGPPPSAEPAMRREDAADQSRGHPGRREARAASAPPGTRAERAAERERAPESIARPRAVLVDEFSEPRSARRGEARALDGQRRPTGGGEGPRGRGGRAEGRALPWDIPLAGARGGQGRERAAEQREPRRDGPEPTISIVRRRPPRERE
jgi:hypothetical protein